MIEGTHPRRSMRVMTTHFATRGRSLVFSIILLALLAACGDDAPQATTPPTLSGQPWTTVPPPSADYSVPGPTVNAEAVCVEVQVDGVLGAGTAQEKAQASLGILGLSPEPGEQCETLMLVTGTARRFCATYSDGSSCCNGWQASGEIVLSAGGEVIRVLPFDQHKPTPNIRATGECFAASDPLLIDVMHSVGGIRKDRPSPLATAVADWFGLPLYIPRSTSQMCPLTEDTFWLFVTALHDDDPNVVSLAVDHLADCSWEWHRDGEPNDGLPYVEAVPHLLSVPELTQGVDQALRGITGEDYGERADPKADWWLWWEANQP